jgi:hypothetical protein
MFIMMVLMDIGMAESSLEDIIRTIITIIAAVVITIAGAEDTDKKEKYNVSM